MKQLIKCKNGLYLFDVLKSIPAGWYINNFATTAPRGYVWITNGKSFFSGERKSALIKL